MNSRCQLIEKHNRNSKLNGLEMKHFISDLNRRTVIQNNKIIYKIKNLLTLEDPNLFSIFKGKILRKKIFFSNFLKDPRRTLLSKTVFFITKNKKKNKILQK